MAGHAGAYGVDGVELGVQHGVVDLVQLFICGTDNYGAGDVAAVAVDPGAHVDNHGFAGLDGFIGGAVVGEGAVWPGSDDSIEADGVGPGVAHGFFELPSDLLLGHAGLDGRDHLGEGLVCEGCGPADLGDFVGLLDLP